MINLWYYSFSKFKLKILPTVDDKYLLVIDDYECDYYNDPNIAADEVYTQSTGYLPFDTNLEEIENLPSDLSKWSKC